MAIHKQTRIQAYQLRARMAILRMIAADSANNRNESTCLNPTDWKGARHWGLHSYESAFCTLDQGHGQWYAHTGEHFRNERDADDIVSSLPRGWFTDIHQDGTAIGIVASLPHGRFIAGYRWTLNDERVYYPEVFTDETEAARRADSHAESFADGAREDDERYQAMTLAELDCEGKTLGLQKAIALRHRAKFGGFDRVRDALQELRDARETLAECTAAYERGSL